MGAEERIFTHHTINCTHTDKVNQHQSEAREKESVDTVVPCAPGKVCNWDTVGDSLQSHKKKERRIHRLLLTQIQIHSDDKGNPQIPEIKYNVNHKQKEGKVWQALVLISPAFVETLVLREQLRTLSWIHASRISGSSSSVGNLSRSSSPLHAADNPSRSSGSLLRCITSKSARNTSVKICSIKALANLYRQYQSLCLETAWHLSRLRRIRVRCHTQSTVLLLRWCPVLGGAGAAVFERTCFPFSSNLLDLLLS